MVLCNWSCVGHASGQQQQPRHSSTNGCFFSIYVSLKGFPKIACLNLPWYLCGWMPAAVAWHYMELIIGSTKQHSHVTAAESKLVSVQYHTTSFQGSTIGTNMQVCHVLSCIVCIQHPHPSFFERCYGYML